MVTLYGLFTAAVDGALPISPTPVVSHDLSLASSAVFTVLVTVVKYAIPACELVTCMTLV